jgi:hypothetical protein
MTTYTVEVDFGKGWEVVSVFEPASETKANERETQKAAFRWALDHAEQGENVRLWIEHDSPSWVGAVKSIGVPRQRIEHPGYSKKVRA